MFCRAVTCEVFCSHPIPPAQGECCPSCAGCFYYGMSRVEGDVFSLSEENCTVCVCLAGNISCISPECTPSPCPSSAQTDCCPCQPAGCHFRGQIYAEGTEFNPDGDDCTTCVCRQGEVGCSFVPCPTPGCPREDWLLAPGQCCFTCRRTAPVTGCFIDDNGVEFPVGQLWSPGDPYCNYKGRKVINGHNFVPEDEPCVYCTCQLGEVSCEKKSCPNTCTEPFGPLAHCCLDCQNNEVTDDLTSLENRVANPVLEDGASETSLQTLQRRSMALVSDSHCSYCSSVPNIPSLTPEVPLEASNASDQETPQKNNS